MNLSCLLSLLKEVPAYKRLTGQLSTTKGKPEAVILNAAKPYFIAALYEELGLPLVVITAQPDDARKLYEQLQAWCPISANLHRFPELDFLPYEYLASYPSNTMLERLRALDALALYEPPASHRQDSELRLTRVTVEQPPLIVTSALAVITKTVSQGDFASACHVLLQGMPADPLDLLRKWQHMGYEMEDIVETPGQLSRRGGIIDVFPPCSQLPARIEFFGNQIESIRLFDPESQKSTRLIHSMTITPAKEVAMHRGKQIIDRLNLNNCTAEVKQRFQEDMLRLQQGQWFQGAEFYFPLLNSATILDYLGDNALLILDAPEETKAVIERLHIQDQELRKVKQEQGKLPQGFPPPYFAWEELLPKIKTSHRLTLLKTDSCQLSATSNEQVLPFSSTKSYGGRLENFLKIAKQMMEQRQRLLIVSQQANRLAELLQEQGIHTPATSQIEQVPPSGSITVLQGSLAGGWVLDGRLNLITDAELFGFVKHARPSKRIPARSSLFLPQLRPGDYVVHVQYGIGRFSGLTKMSADGGEQEYLVLEYAAGDKLYVPTDQIERVSQYIGASDQAPTLSRLGTPEWQRTKRRVEESVADIAQELLALYAAREVTQGFAFSPDTLWQQEMEASFPYMETPDQIEAIVAVKEDMEKSKPMDRLICGDVGYGKTEVALRAAFKAVMDNKQVAILAPTTVLAQQHFTTFSERLQAFPLKIEMLSRFRSPQKEREILDGLGNGTVDICIGTHRLLQKDIASKDLGLVIIDEEQQFGVVQKEKLKQMRREVDSIALSATPIPRTLHMSLTGIRDMSTMETPPEERLSIKTYVGVYDDSSVRQAVLRELERNGQAFFVHNRVQSIALAASKLQALVPQARIAIAHGQMSEEELEKVMTEFIAGNHDVLVTTTIIQLGLDMPNVNTLIIDQADKFGLAQLYQLRGRVGRGINQAYAYFLSDKGKQLTPQAHKRLRTILEATELGAGFGIAMKDLEIRGAGNLLGVKQSGHIAELGFDLYCQLLAEAVEELKAKQLGETRKKKTKFTPSISLPLTTYIPEEYVPNLSTRLSFYRRLATIEFMEEIEDIARELRDRFGALPQPVENLLYAVKAKVLATKAEVSSISTQGRQIVIKPQETSRLSLNKKYNGAIKKGATQLRLYTKHPTIKWTEALEEILQSMACSSA